MLYIVQEVWARHMNYVMGGGKYKYTYLLTTSVLMASVNKSSPFESNKKGNMSFNGCRISTELICDCVQWVGVCIPC